MKLRLIGPEDEFEVDWWFTDNSPAVIVVQSAEVDRVWVKSANSIADNHMYFEQLGIGLLSPAQLTKVK